MQYKPGNWVTGFKRSPRAANVQHRDMGLFLNSSGKFEPIDDSWDNLHSGGLFISDDNKLYFRDETNKDIYINSPAAETLGLSAGNATTEGFVTINEEGFDTDFRVEASGEANALHVVGSSGNVGIGTNPSKRLHVKGLAANYGTIQIESTSPNHGAELLLGDGVDPDYGGIVQFATSSGEGGRMRFIAGTTETMNLRGGNMGIGTNNPGTLLELFGTAPYLTLRNSTHENTEGGRESKIIFEGEQTDGSDSTLAVIQASHDGTSDDEKGDLIFYTNDGNDAAAPTEAMRIDSAGNVGIGTTDPSHPLEVVGGIARFSRADTTPVGTASTLFNDGVFGSTDTANTGITVFGSGQTGLAFADAGGNVQGQVRFSHSTNKLEFSTDNSATIGYRMGTADFTLETGNLVIGTAGKGIDFSNQTPASGMTAELLDHYEEGTFTPTLLGSTTNPTVSYGLQSGEYTRIGNILHCRFSVGTSANTGGAGNIRIGGLPFTQSSSGSKRTETPLSGYNLNVTSGTFQLAAEGVASQSYFDLKMSVDNAAWTNPDWGLATNATTYFNGSITILL